MTTALAVSVPRWNQRKVTSRPAFFQIAHGLADIDKGVGEDRRPADRRGREFDRRCGVRRQTQNVSAESASIAPSSVSLARGLITSSLVASLSVVARLLVTFLLSYCTRAPFTPGWSNRSCQTCSRRLMNSRLATRRCARAAAAGRPRAPRAHAPAARPARRRGRPSAPPRRWRG